MITNPDGRGSSSTSQELEYQRRHIHKTALTLISEKILHLHEPRFITPPPTTEFLEALVTMADARLILELGTYSGFGTLHLIRSILGKSGGKVVSIDCRPEHDKAFFSRPEIAPWFEHIAEWTPQCLEQLKGRIFDFVFVDSDHSVSHCEKELAALIEITRPGSIFTFHDCPKRQTADAIEDGVIYQWLESKVESGLFKGLVLPTCEQIDCLAAFGPGYDSRLNPHLGVFIRQ